MIYYRIFAFGIALIVKRTTASVVALAVTAAEGGLGPLCPEVKPADGDACSVVNNDGCEYEEFCCEGDGTCLPRYTCYCDGFTTTCSETVATILCPSVCPELPPMRGDSCDVDARYLCTYGEAVVCDDPNYSLDYEEICQCFDGTFTCRSIACPVPCPVTEPVQGDACSPFIERSCNFGELCCGDECVHDRDCFCDDFSNLKLECTETRMPCPLACPATKPEEGGLCNISGRFDCEYDSGTCLNDEGKPDINCRCVSGAFTCTQKCNSMLGGDGIADGDAGGGGVKEDQPVVLDEAPHGGAISTRAKAKQTKKGAKKRVKKAKKLKKKNTRRLGSTSRFYSITQQ